jgi:hypothetical protein
MSNEELPPSCSSKLGVPMHITVDASKLINADSRNLIVLLEKKN